MTESKSIALISTIVNFFLALLKIGVGFFVKSTAIIADGIHTGLDILSSFVTYLGIRIAKKSADKKHPYGHQRAETIAGFFVTFLLLITALWIIFEGVSGLIQKEFHKIPTTALLVVVISILTNEIMARIKFKFGREENNLALIADAEHSRADSISSIGVLVGLFLGRWFWQADGITAILIGIYILYETYILGKEITGNLLDISNPEIEEKIKKICEKEEIDLLDIKTRKIGAENFAEFKIGLNKEWKVEKANEVIDNLEKLLLEKIKDLKFVVVQVASHDLKHSFVRRKIGGVSYFEENLKKIEIKKLGKRTIIPQKNNKFYKFFGAPEYLLIDQAKDGKVLQKKKVKNPYFVIGRGHGLRFTLFIKADRVFASQIGDTARQRLEKAGVEIKILPKETNIETILKSLK